ncbi:hypothetical protein CC99x_007160 [Candidatus Berkiella cookevillensis]|uniref:Uncharacterized protein n=1 Tax=Candidatus Berkiella cookevillensis TaxID=437022 RepID=A0A0Q9YCD8_9GAMM|nr:hypothetical protein [Candidatus Berkiella cookevillensis]MCS5708685.1 hypothetical protein [Candidatus Berkiella cookevillensis]
MTTSGPLPQPLTPPKKPAFKLGLHLSPQSHKVATRLPKHTAINDLWELNINNLGNEITQCISMLFSHIVERGEPREEIDTFHHSTAATALWEAHHGKKIKGKDHAIKAGGLFNKVRNLLSTIKSTLKYASLDEEQEEILLNFQAILIGHHNNLVVALQKQPQAKKDHLEQNANIKVDELKKIGLTTAQQTRIRTVLPASPIKTTQEKCQQATPKKRSRSDKLSILALQSDRPLTKEDFDNFLSTSVETTTPEVSNDAPNVEAGIALPMPSPIPFLIPRQIMMKAKTAVSTLATTHKRLLFADTSIKETTDAKKDTSISISDTVEPAKDLVDKSFSIHAELMKKGKLVTMSTEPVSDDADTVLLGTVQSTVLTGYKSHKEQHQKLLTKPIDLSIPEDAENLAHQKTPAKTKLSKTTK